MTITQTATYTSNQNPFIPTETASSPNRLHNWADVVIDDRLQKIGQMGGHKFGKPGGDLRRELVYLAGIGIGAGQGHYQGHDFERLLLQNCPQWISPSDLLYQWRRAWKQAKAGTHNIKAQYPKDRPLAAIGKPKAQSPKNTITLAISEYLASKHIVNLPKFTRLIARTGIGKNTAVRGAFPNLILIEPTRMKCAQEIADYPDSYYAFDGMDNISHGLGGGQIVTTPESFFHVVRNKGLDYSKFVVCVDEMHLISTANYRRDSYSDTADFLQADWAGVILMSGTDATLLGPFFDKFTSIRVEAPKRTQNATIVGYEKGSKALAVSAIISQEMLAAGAGFRGIVALNDKGTQLAAHVAALKIQCGLKDEEIAAVNADTLDASWSQELISGQWPQGVRVIFATAVLETGININSKTDCAIFADAPGSQAAEQMVNRFRGKAPQKAYVLYPRERLGDKSTFNPDFFGQKTISMARQFVRILNANTGISLNDPTVAALTKQAHGLAKRLGGIRGLIRIETDDSGRDFYAIDEISIAQSIAAETKSQERQAPEYFKDRMVAYGWKFAKDETIKVAADSVTLAAMQQEKEAFKAAKAAELEQHGQELESIGETRARAAVKAGAGANLLRDLARIALTFLMFVSDWKTAVSLAMETGGKQSKLNKLKRQFKVQEKRRNSEVFTLAIYALFDVGETIGLDEARGRILKFFKQSPLLKYDASLRNSRLVTNANVSNFLRDYFTLERKRVRQGGKVLSLYHFADDSPKTAGGLRLADILSQRGNPWV